VSEFGSSFSHRGGVHFNTTDGRLRAWRGAPRRGLGDLDRLGQTISHCMHEMNGNERKYDVVEILVVENGLVF